MNETVIPMRIEGGEIQVKATLGQTVIKVVAPDEYTGSTEVTPSDQTQVLETKDKLVREDITVEGITGTQVITQNGEYDVVDKATVIVNNPAQWTSKGIADGTEPYGDIDLGDVTSITGTAFSGRKNITSITAKQVISASQNALRDCSALSELHLPRLRNTSQSMLQNCTSLKFVYLPSVQGISTASFNDCKALETLIFLDCWDLGQYNPFTMVNAMNLKTIVLGHSSPIKTSINTFSSTPYAQGGSGGEIYIPKALYDHLGDGNNLDYLKNSVWNTLNSYGTITWKQIEGSEYETYMPGGEKYNEEMALT